MNHPDTENEPHNKKNQHQSTVEICLFGAPQIHLDGNLTNGLRSKTQGLLFYLAMTRQTHLRTTLATLFWGDLNEKNARASLRKVLQQLRATIPHHIDIDTQSVGLNAESELWVDAVAFVHKLEQAADSNEINLIIDAIDLYQADFLTGFLVRSAPEFEAWQSAQQARLREMMVTALQTLSQHWIAQNELTQAIAATRRIVELEPWREESHCQLMELFASKGDRAAAIAQYEICCELLDRELSVLPAEETVQLYEQIRSGEFKNLSSFEPNVGIPTQIAPPHYYLPTQSTTLVGRENELKQLSRLLTNTSTRLITIFGPGGIGKTRLALETANQQFAHFVDGVTFIRFAGLNSIESIIPTIAEELSFSFYEGSPPQQQLQHHLREKKLLLILDNFEHLGDGIKLVVDLLQASTHLKVLVTSRIRLNIQDEHCFSLAGIDISTPESAKSVDSSHSQRNKPSARSTRSEQAQKIEIETQSSAVQLFVNVANRATSDFVLTAENIESVIRVCHMVEGMPLGIILAASWIELLTPCEIARELEESADFLESEMPDLPKRQQSMRAVFQQSWNLLAEPERNIFQQVSIFRGGFTREAAEAVTETSLQTLMHLLHKSLLQRDSTGRFEMHELLRQYAAEKLADHPHKQRDVQNRHGAFYCDFLHQRESTINGVNQQSVLAEIETELENIQLGWTWAINEYRLAELDQAYRGLYEFYTIQSRFQEGYKDFSRAVTAIQNEIEPLSSNMARSASSSIKTSANDNAHEIFTGLFARQGAYSVELGDYEAAISMLQQSLALAKQLDLQPVQSFCLKFLGEMQQHIGEQPEAERLYRESLAISQAIGDQLEQANLSEKIGWVKTMSGQNDEAYRLFEQSLTLYQAVQHQYGIARLQERLAFITWQQGKYEESEKFVTQSLQMFEELGSRIGIAKALGGLGLVACAADSSKFPYAKEVSLQRLELTREIGQPLEMAISLGWLAYVCIQLGEYPEAKIYAKELLALSKRAGHMWSISWAYCLQCEIASAQGNFQKAWAYMDRSLALTEETQAHPVLFMSVIHLSFLIAKECKQFNHPQSNQEESSEQRIYEPARTEQAIDLLSFVISYPATWQIYRDKAAQLREELEAQLPIEAVEAARLRGAARNLAEIVSEFVTHDLVPEVVPEEAISAQNTNVFTSPHLAKTTSTPQLFGIDAARDELLERLQQTDSPWLVSIDGIGGIGKTTLAQALVDTLTDTSIGTDRFARIAWVSAKQAEFRAGFGTEPIEQFALSADQLIDSLLEQLTEQDPPASQREKEAQLRHLLKEEPTLVVVDNLETMADYEALVPTLRDLAKPSKFLITSRHALTHYSDIFCLTLGEINQQATFDLLRHEATMRGIRSLANASDEALTQIMNVVGGHPLALGLVVGQLSILPLDQVLENLKQTRGQHVDELYTYIYWQAWRVLDKPARRLLLAMPMSDNGTYAQLAAVTKLAEQDLQSALTQLIGLSLVQVTGDLHEPRYGLHRLTETFLMNEVLKWTEQTAPANRADAAQNATTADGQEFTDSQEIIDRDETVGKPAQLSPQFVAGPPIAQPHHFFGRNEELSRIFGWWQNAPMPHITLIGPRRSGKTSLLMYLQSITATDQSSLRPQQKQDWLSSPKQYRWVEVNFLDPRMRSKERLLRHLLTGFGLDAPDLCSIETFMDIVCLHKWDHPAIVLMDALAAGMAAPELDQPFWWMLRSLSQATDGYLAFIVATHEQPTRLAEDRGKSSPFFNTFTTLKLGPLTQPEAVELIASSPVAFAESDIEWILEQSGRWPYLLQICCQERLRTLEADQAEAGQVERDQVERDQVERDQDSEGWKDAALERIEPFGYLKDDTR